jgi:hypothetical protein
MPLMDAIQRKSGMGFYKIQEKERKGCLWRII